MVGDGIRKEALAALSVAAAELIEDHHDALVLSMPDDATVQHERMLRLRRLGAQLIALGRAGEVLLGVFEGEVPGGPQ